MSLVPRLEAFALPDYVERATQRNPRRRVYIITTNSHYTLLTIITHRSGLGVSIKTSHEHLSLLCPDIIWKFAKFQDVKNKAQINAFT